MRKFMYSLLIVAVMAVAYLGLKAQVPTGPVVIMYTPSYQAVQLFADGSVVLPPLPAGTVLRVPPQDSNDVGMILNQFGRAVCTPVNGVTHAACTTYKITVGK